MPTAQYSDYVTEAFGLWGRSASVSKSRVSDYVADFASTLEKAGVPNRYIAARYENEQADWVDITCYTETVPGNSLPAIEGKRLFVPEDIYFAMRTTGLSGEYNYFDSCYAVLGGRKPSEHRSGAAGVAVEIYTDYPHDGVHGKTFEALILS
ncbi:hypothetical protein VWZ88_13375 [Phaeobacter sp. JH20_36]|uniref:hypothetical protein n=1 Tax=unclassified Phaeobacter TaxID=2621772 RepID=UPI003A85BEFD